MPGKIVVVLADITLASDAYAIVSVHGYLVCNAQMVVRTRSRGEPTRTERIESSTFFLLELQMDYI